MNFGRFISKPRPSTGKRRHSNRDYLIPKQKESCIQRLCKWLMCCQ